MKLHSVKYKSPTITITEWALGDDLLENMLVDRDGTTYVKTGHGQVEPVVASPIYLIAKDDHWQIVDEYEFTYSYEDADAAWREKYQTDMLTSLGRLTLTHIESGIAEDEYRD